MKKSVSVRMLNKRGIEAFVRKGRVLRRVELPVGASFEPPCGPKWAQFDHSIEFGAFSYMVSGYAFAAQIGRYCSIAEDVQIGRQNHPTTGISTSPAFFRQKLGLGVGRDFDGATDFHNFVPSSKETGSRLLVTTIENDVWIGHGAFIRAGITIRTGAIVAAHAVVTKDVPPYAVVAGNPAVVKKYRLPEDVIPILLKSRWWRFAPWQLGDLYDGDIRAFCAGVEELPEQAEYAPQRLVI